MEYQCTIEGVSPLIMHSCAGMDEDNPFAKEKAEIIRKKGANRTSADKVRIKEIDTALGFWINESGEPEIPTTAVRRMLEDAAKKLKQGPLVREGIIVTKTAFHYDKALGETLDELAKNKEVQLTVPAVIQRNRILVTRPHFKQWKLEFTVDAEDDIVDISQLQQWLEIGGRRVGIGAWRPTNSGYYGRFKLVSIEEKGNNNE